MGEIMGDQIPTLFRSHAKIARPKTAIGQSDQLSIS